MEGTGDQQFSWTRARTTDGQDLQEQQQRLHIVDISVAHKLPRNELSEVNSFELCPVVGGRSILDAHIH